jgi:hypothetical protein
MKHVVVANTENGKVDVKEVESNVDGLIVWRIGNNDRPATAEDIVDFQQALAAALAASKDAPLHIVTHHAVDVIQVNLGDGCCQNECCKNVEPCPEGCDKCVGDPDMEVEERRECGEDCGNATCPKELTR